MYLYTQWMRHFKDINLVLRTFWFWFILRFFFGFCYFILFYLPQALALCWVKLIKLAIPQARLGGTKRLRRRRRNWALWGLHFVFWTFSFHLLHFRDDVAIFGNILRYVARYGHIFRPHWQNFAGIFLESMRVAEESCLCPAFFSDFFLHICLEFPWLPCPLWMVGGVSAPLQHIPLGTISLLRNLKCDRVATASKDCTVKVWKLTGQGGLQLCRSYLTPWNLPEDPQ